MSSVNTESLDKGDMESSPKLPDVIDPRVAADSLREHADTLVKAFRHCLSSLADSLYSQSIIPEDAHRKLQRESLDEDERSRALMSCVEAKLEIEPSDFKKFVAILKSEPFFGTLGSKLVQSYCTLSSISTTKCPATISPAISQYAAYLKGVYRDSPISPDSKWPPTPSKKYINLVTFKRGYKCQDDFIGYALNSNVREDLDPRKNISMNRILVPDKKGVTYLKLVLVEGAPGIGKSTLAWELCRRWEQGSMEKYSLTVLLRLREKEVQEIRSFVELFHGQGEVLIKELSSNNGKGVLFILDGFDELPTTLQKEGVLVDLIRGTFLPECTVLVTSRPSATAELLKICHPLIQKRIEVLGFTQESVEEYATSTFSCEPERLQKFKAFISARDNPAINSLMCAPLNAAIIVEIYRNSRSDHLLPHTLTQVYTQLCLMILNRYLQNISPSAALVKEFKNLPGELCLEFLKLSKVAFDGMKRQEVIFHTLPSDLVHFGFLDTVSSLYGGGSISYNFPHFTIQEFFAAYHISQLCGDARLALLKECGRDSRWNVVWRFVAGLTEFKFFEGHLNSDLFVKESKENEIEVKDLFVQCLYEANIEMDRSKLFGLKNIGIWGTGRFRRRRQPQLYLYALGYCIANLTTEASWNLGVECNLSSIFFSGLKTNDNISGNGNINRLYTSLELLEYFPLRGITDLSLKNSTFAHLTRLLPSMTSLKRLSIPHCSFSDSQCADKFLQQLSQTDVTSLYIEYTDLTESVSALQPLIDPQMGTLEELRLGLMLCNDAALLDVVCAPSSLKSLELVYPNNISSLTQLQTNTRLTKLEIEYNISDDMLKVIVGILEHNKTLEHLLVGPFDVGVEIHAIKDVVGALARNDTLRCVKIVIFISYNPFDGRNVTDYMTEDYPEIYFISDHRIEWVEPPI